MKTELINICSVVVGDSLSTFLSQLEQVQQFATFVELRVDYISNLSPKIIQLIKEHTYLPAILCCRSIIEGGKFTGSIAAQQEILQTANDSGFEYIDIDSAIIDKITIKNKKIKVIITYHNFDKTPSLDELNQIANRMRLYQSDLLKFAVMTHHDDDVKVLFKFLASKKPQEKICVIGMGEMGKPLRLLSPLLGGYLTFASSPSSKSAPGQIDIFAMKELYQRMNDTVIAECVTRIQEEGSITWEEIISMIQLSGNPLEVIKS